MSYQPNDIILRNVKSTDLPIFYDQQLDKTANFMAAFTSKDPSDRDTFMRHWEKILSDKEVKNRTILFEGKVAGHIARYVDKEFGKPEVTYWIGRDFWGRGIATQALSEFLRQEETTRPIYARVAKDNIASRRVLEKCGYKIIGEGKGFANARNQEVEEFIMEFR